MENTDQIHSFIRLVMNENLAQAQSVIREALNAKLSEALDEKFEAYAPAIFEELNPGEEEEELDPVGEEDPDIDNDGDEDKSDDYLINRRKARGEAINGEEGVEGNEGDKGDEEEEDVSDQQLQSDENWQDLPSSEKMSSRYGIRSTQYPGTAGSDGY